MSENMSKEDFDLIKTHPGVDVAISITENGIWLHKNLLNTDETIFLLRFLLYQLMNDGQLESIARHQIEGE